MSHTHISHIEHPPGVKNRAIYGITDNSAYLASVTIEGITHNRFIFMMTHGREWLERLEAIEFAAVEVEREQAAAYLREVRVQDRVVV